MKNIRTMELFYKDLNDDAKRRFLEFNNCKEPSDGNYDDEIEGCPITILEVEDPSIQIFSISDFLNVNPEETDGIMRYIGLGYIMIDINHPKKQIDICGRELHNDKIKIFTLSPFVIQWAVDNCVPIIDYFSGVKWEDEDYAKFHDSLKGLPLKLIQD